VDSYRNVLGLAAVTIVQAYLGSQEDLRDSDEARVEFAKYALDHLRFTFKKTKGDVSVGVQPYTFTSANMQGRTFEDFSMVPWCYKPLPRTSPPLAAPVGLLE
jgi:hypothetical protein